MTIPVFGIVAVLFLASATAFPPTSPPSPRALPQGIDLHPAQTPPSYCDGGNFSATLTITSPTPASGPAGTHLTVEGTGFYNPGQSGLVQIWLMAESGGTVLLALADVASGTPEPFNVTIDFPGVGTEGGLSLGTYYLWGLTQLTPANCADAAFTLTGENPGLPCENYSPQLSVISPTPALGSAGTSVQLQGVGFSEDNLTYIYWAAADGSRLTFLENVTSSPVGGWYNTTAVVPTGFAPGIYFFWGLGSAYPYACAGAEFNLTAGGPAIALTPATGPGGTVVTVTGTGFSMSDTGVNITGAVLLFPLPCTLSGGSITGNCSFQVDGGIAGKQTITGVGNVIGGPGDTATATFGLYPSIALNLTSGPIGTSFTISGYDFSASPSAADVTFDGDLLAPTGGPDCARGGSDTEFTLDALGQFVCTFTVPSWATSGANSVQGDDSFTGDLTAAVTFTLTAGPSLGLSPTSGPAATLVTVTGSGFSASDTSITITGTMLLVPLACTLSGGSIAGSCSFAVDGGLAGPNTVTGVGNVVGGLADTGVATFTVYPSLSVSPVSGPMGTSFTVSGYDFSASPSAADVTFDGDLLAPTGGSDCGRGGSDTEFTLDALGQFVCTFTVPAWATAGANSVQGDDSFTGELTAAETFTVTVPTVLELSNPAGAAGATSFSVGGLAPDTAYEVYLDRNEGVQSADSQDLGTCTSSSTGTITDCTVTIPSGLGSGTYYVDLYQDPNPPPYIFSVFHFSVAPPAPAKGAWNPLGLTGFEYEIVGGVVVALVAIAAGLVLLRRRRKTRSVPGLPEAPATRQRPQGPS